MSDLDELEELEKSIGPLYLQEIDGIEYGTIASLINLRNAAPKLIEEVRRSRNKLKDREAAIRCLVLARKGMPDHPCKSCEEIISEVT